MAEMTRRRVRHLPVVDDGRLVGIVSIGDVVKSRLGEVELEATVLREAYIATTDSAGPERPLLPRETGAEAASELAQRTGLARDNG
jgi:CBS-domain-containing membrane protein